MIVVVLFNLGAPCCSGGVRPFLFNLFNDKAMITLANPFRWMLAHFISRRRAPMVNKKVYSRMGGRSPLIEGTHAQANALRDRLHSLGVNAQVVVAMNYAPPTIEQAVDVVKASSATKVALLPLYPQFSTTTTGSAINAWKSWARRKGMEKDTIIIKQYPEQKKFIEAYATLIRDSLETRKDQAARIVFSAHSLPQKIIDKGDPYEKQVHVTVNAIVNKLSSWGIQQDWVTCYQSKVGPLKWLKPSLDQEIKRAGKDGIGILVVPVSFVSEHSETLVELDGKYKEIAKAVSVPFFIRVPTVSTMPLFIDALSEMVLEVI